MSVLQVLTSGFLFCMIRYQVIKTVPFNMLEMLMAHHAPFNPNAVEDRIRDMGILSAFKVIPTTEGGTVFPRPLKAPAVVASIHLGSWESPIILR